MASDEEMKRRARELRQNMTPEERKLWFLFLRTHPARFRRQRRDGKYIMDFYCVKARLCIELDGDQHFDEEGRLYDEKRTGYLVGRDMAVLRFTNREVNQQFQKVCETIDTVLAERLGYNVWDR